MPIKEFIAFGAIVLASIVAAHPTRPREAIRELEIKIVREAARTDNWYDCRDPVFGGCRFMKRKAP